MHLTSVEAASARKKNSIAAFGLLESVQQCSDHDTFTVEKNHRRAKVQGKKRESDSKSQSPCFVHFKSNPDTYKGN